jgi:hypothetical protein
MSTRLGMGDGRCITSYDSSKLMNDFIMMKNGIAYEDNFKYRRFLQNADVEALSLPAKNSACGRPIRFSS